MTFDGEVQKFDRNEYKAISFIEMQFSRVISLFLNCPLSINESTT